MRARVRCVCVSVIACILQLGCPANIRSPSSEEITAHIRSILELPTFEHIYRDIVYIDKERSFLIFKTMQTAVLFSVDVRVQAGFDLSEGLLIAPKGTNALQVALPPAKILLIDADENSIHQYFIKEVGGSISRLEYYDEINRKKAELVTDSIKRGILEKAAANARILISSYLTMAGFTDITFIQTGDSRR